MSARAGSSARTEADELETETEDMDLPANEGAEVEDAFGDEFSNLVREGLEEDDEEQEDDELDVDGEDFDDDEDEDDEDEELEGEDGEGEEGDEGEDGEGDAQPRDAQGRYAKPEGGKDGQAAGAAAGDGKAGDAQAAAGKDGAQGAPQWEPLVAKVNQEDVPIEEARVMRANGYAYVAIPEGQFSRFQQRIQRGVVGERKWRELDQGLRELQAERSVHRKSDAEIEAEIVNEFLKPYLKEFLDDRDLAHLEDKIKLAQQDARSKYDTEVRTKVEEASQPSWEEQQVQGLASLVLDFAQNHPELQGKLSREALEEVYEHELLPVRDSLVYRKDADILANTQYIFDRLKARAAAGQPAPKDSTASASSQTPASSGHSATTATKARQDQAERFNRGVDAARPRSTSVKANRDARPPKRTTRDHDQPRRRRLTPQEEQARAEDRYRRTERAFLSSPSLDFDGPDDDDGE